MVLYQEAILVKEFFSTLMYSPVKFCWYNTEIGRVERSVYSELDIHDPPFTILYSKCAVIFTACWN